MRRCEAFSFRCRFWFLDLIVDAIRARELVNFQWPVSGREFLRFGWVAVEAMKLVDFGSDGIERWRLLAMEAEELAWFAANLSGRTACYGPLELLNWLWLLECEVCWLRLSVLAARAWPRTAPPTCD